MTIILRYMPTEGKIPKERLFSVVQCKSSTAMIIKEQICENLRDTGLDLKYLIGNSTDGAANMQGTYNGFSSHLSLVVPEQIHIWCYAHILNLVMVDTTSKIIEISNLFSLLNLIAAFIKESYKRMDIWAELVKESGDTRRLNTIGTTRWWSKDALLTKIFGNFDDPNGGLFVVTVRTLSKIAQNANSNGEVRFQANNLKSSLLCYKTILTAQIFLRVFQHTSPLSKYFQTKGLDLLQAQSMTEKTIEKLNNISQEFQVVNKAAQNFIKWANAQLDKELEDFEVETELPPVRSRKRKVLDGEIADDELLFDPIQKFRADVYDQALRQC